MKDLMQLIESKQFMAHANSILEAESSTTTNAGDKVCKWSIIFIDFTFFFDIPIINFILFLGG